MKITFITTVLNEENTIEKLLLSLNTQIELPDEAIIVDGGSNDGTVKKINKFIKSKDNHLNLIIINKKGNRSIGRNTAINSAKGNIIVATDGGCTLEKYWLSNLIKGFEEGADVVGGYYKPIANNVFEKCLATYTSTMTDKIDSENFLPSSRSIAFKKSAWKKVEGYPEWLDYSEDLYFSRELKKNKLIFNFSKNAIVYWPQRNNLLQASIQFYNYALGDGISRYIRRSAPFLYGRYLGVLIMVFLYFISGWIFLLVLLGTLLANYVLWAIFKNYSYVNEKKAIVYLPLLQFTADFSVLLGMTIGFIKSFSIKNKKNT